MKEKGWEREKERANLNSSLLVALVVVVADMHEINTSWKSLVLSKHNSWKQTVAKWIFVNQVQPMSQWANVMGISGCFFSFIDTRNEPLGFYFVLCLSILFMWCYCSHFHMSYFISIHVFNILCKWLDSCQQTVYNNKIIDTKQTHRHLYLRIFFKMP